MRTATEYKIVVTGLIGVHSTMQRVHSLLNYHLVYVAASVVIDKGLTCWLHKM